MTKVLDIGPVDKYTCHMLRTINDETMAMHIDAIAEQLQRMWKAARDDEALAAHVERLDMLAELSGDLADAVHEARSILPGTAWIVQDR